MHFPCCHNTQKHLKEAVLSARLFGYLNSFFKLGNANKHAKCQNPSSNCLMLDVYVGKN